MYIDHARALSRTGETGWESTALTSLDEGIKRLGRGSILLGYAIDLEVQRGAIEAALQRIEEQIAIPGYRFQALVKKAEILEQAGRDDAHNAYVEARAALDALPGKVKRTYAVRKLLTRATDGVKSTGGNLEESGSSGRYVSDR